MANICFCGRRFDSPSALQQHQQSSALPICASAASNTSDPETIGDEVGSITRSETLQLSGSEVPVSSSGASDVICSYNWAHMAHPTVYVPGGAPVYRPTALPMKIQPDTGVQYIDLNASRMPQYPFEVVFHAVEIMNSTFRFDSIAVLLNRNSLRKFFDFCMGRTQDSFRVNLFMVKNTLIIERCVRSTKEFLNGSGGSGYGHNFERATTKLPPGLEDSSAHHRVLRYDLGGLQCAVRFEVDASYDNPNETGDKKAEGAEDAAPRDDIGSLEAGFSSMALGKGAGTPAASDVFMSTIARGSGTPQASLAELKTQTILKSRPKAIPQLWFGRTRYLIKGCHQGGVFDKVSVEDCREKLVAWENYEANQNGLRKMVLLLSRLRDIVGMTEGKACVAVYEKAANSALRVFVSTSGKAPLPGSIIDKFWDA